MGLPRTDAQRVDKYDAKTNAATVGLKIAAKLTPMKADFATFANDFVADSILINAALGTDATIFPIWYGGYQAYGAQLWRLQKTATGAIVDATAQVIKTKWTTRGLVPSMLIKIAVDVFGITVT
jgi:hypothetical protein